MLQFFVFVNSIFVYLCISFNFAIPVPRHVRTARLENAHAPRWEVRKSPWTAARAEHLQKFKFDNIDVVYKKTINGRNDCAKQFDDDFIIEADDED